MTSVSELYVDLGYGGDPRLGTLGLLTIATVGQQAVSQLGELWVSYDIELIRPKLLGGIPSTGQSYTASVFGAAAITNSTPFAQLANSFPVGSLPNGSDIDISFPVTPGTSADFRTISFPIGTSGAYFIEYVDYGAPAQAGISGNFSFGNGVRLSNYFNTSPTAPHGSAYGSTPLLGVTSNVVVWTFLAVFDGSPFPLFGALQGFSVNNGGRPYVTVPNLSGPDGTGYTTLRVLPVSFFN
jgi:hypothetical protein